MLTGRLSFKLVLMFVALFALLILPFSAVLYYDSIKMVETMDSAEPLTPDQRAAFVKSSDAMMDNMIFMSFYVFFLAYVLALFFSKKLFDPVKQLYNAVLALKEGRYDVRLDIHADDDMGEMSRAFNDVAADIRKKNTELLKAKNYIWAMSDPVWVVDDDNVVTDINPAFTNLFGYSREEAVGSLVFDFMDEESEKMLIKMLYERDSLECCTYELTFISKKEGRIPVVIKSGQIEGGRICVIRDYRAEAALRDSLNGERLNNAAVMDSITDPMYVIDREYKIERTNTAARMYHGRDVAGEKCHEVFHGKNERCYLHGEECPARSVFDSGSAFNVVHEHEREGGKRAFHEVHSFPVKDRSGAVRQVITYMRDVTDRRKFEDEIELKNRELTALNSISMLLSRSLKSTEVFSEVMGKIVEVFGLDGGGMYFLDEMGRNLVCRFHRGLSEEFVKSSGRIMIGEDMPGRVALNGSPIISADISRDRRAEKSSLRHSGVKAYACVPIKGKEKMLGVFFLLGFSAREFKPEEERILNSISEMMGISFENANLYEKLRELYEHHRRRRKDEQKSLLQLSSMLATTLDMDNVLSSCLSLIMESLRADYAWLLLFGDSGDLALKTATDESQIKPGAVMYAQGVSSPEQYCVQKREPLTVPDLNAEQRFRLHPAVAGYRSSCSIPVYIGDKNLGAFTVFYKAFKKEPGDEEIHFLQTVSSVLAVSLERGRLYENIIIQRGMAEAILQGITDGVITVDTAQNIISMNGAAERISGARAGKSVGLPLGAIFDSLDNTEFRLRLLEGLERASKGDVATTETSLVSAEGRRLSVVFRCAPVMDDKGNIAGVVVVIRDLSAEREVDAMKTDFVRSVSHEFRTPLTAIVGMTEMVLDTDVHGARAREYLDTVLSEANRLSEMVSDVLDVARMQIGKEIPADEAVDFKAMLRELKDELESSIQKKSVKYSALVNGESEGFRGDYSRLKQMMENLIENALKYSDQGASVDVRITREGDSIVIAVRDTGWGIDADDLQHVGEKFFRGAHGKRTKGTGLGLAICGEIAKLHGGGMKIQSVKGGGTRIAVELPFRRG